ATKPACADGHPHHDPAARGPLDRCSAHANHGARRLAAARADGTRTCGTGAAIGEAPAIAATVGLASTRRIARTVRGVARPVRVGPTDFARTFSRAIRRPVDASLESTFDRPLRDRTAKQQAL